MALSPTVQARRLRGLAESTDERRIERGSMMVMRSAREGRMLRCTDGTTSWEWMGFRIRMATFSAIRDRFGLHSFLLSWARCLSAYLTPPWCFTCKYLCPYRSGEHWSIEIVNDAYIPPNSPIPTSIVLNVDSFAYRLFARECRVWYTIRYLGHVAISLN